MHVTRGTHTRPEAQPPPAAAEPFAERRLIADRVFQGALLFNGALTVFWSSLMFDRGDDDLLSGIRALDGVAHAHRRRRRFLLHPLGIRLVRHQERAPEVLRGAREGRAPARFQFLMVPLGLWLASMFPPERFAALFPLIWGSYLAWDAAAEIGGALYGRQQLRVWGIGDVNRKSIAGTVTGGPRLADSVRGRGGDE